MKGLPLLPRAWRAAGACVTCVGAVMAMARFFFGWQPKALETTPFAAVAIYFQPKYFRFIDNNVTEEIAGLLLLAGIFCIAFSRERVEDERTAAVRLRALVLAVYINCGLLALSLALVYGFAFVAVMAANLYSTLLVYIVTFRVLMFAGRR